MQLIILMRCYLFPVSCCVALVLPGLISDAYSIFSYHRKSYFALGTSVYIVSMSVLVVFDLSLMHVAIVLNVASVGLVIADVAGDTILVETIQMTRNSVAGSELMSGNWIGFYAG